MISFDRNEAANHQVTGEDDLTKAAGTKGSHELVSRRHGRSWSAIPLSMSRLGQMTGKTRIVVLTLVH